MTIRTSPAVLASQQMPGDFVVITAGNGATITGLGGVSAPLVAGAFGKLEIDGQGSLVVRMHELMPNEFRALQTIALSGQTQVQRVTMDNDNEAAVLALKYLRSLGNIMTSRVVGGEHLRPLLVAQMGSEAQRITEKLAESGLSVVEVVKREVVETKQVYLTSDPQSMRDGAFPIDAVSFEFAPTKHSESNVEVFDAARAQEVLYADRQVSEGTRAAQGAPAAAAQPALSPFMRGLLGMNPPADDGLTGNDLGLGGNDDNDDDGDRYGMNG